MHSPTRRRRQVNSFRQTQLGSVASSIFFFWFIFSGLLWRCITWGLPLALLANWLYPGALQAAVTNAAQDSMAEAASRAQVRVLPSNPTCTSAYI